MLTNNQMLRRDFEAAPYDGLWEVESILDVRGAVVRVRWADAQMTKHQFIRGRYHQHGIRLPCRRRNVPGHEVITVKWYDTWEPKHNMMELPAVADMVRAFLAQDQPALIQPGPDAPPVPPPMPAAVPRPHHPVPPAAAVLPPAVLVVAEPEEIDDVPPLPIRQAGNNISLANGLLHADQSIVDKPRLSWLLTEYPYFAAVYDFILFVSLELILSSTPREVTPDDFYSTGDVYITVKKALHGLKIREYLDYFLEDVLINHLGTLTHARLRMHWCHYVTDAIHAVNVILDHALHYVLHQEGCTYSQLAREVTMITQNRLKVYNGEDIDNHQSEDVRCGTEYFVTYAKYVIQHRL